MRWWRRGSGSALRRTTVPALAAALAVVLAPWGAAAPGAQAATASALVPAAAPVTGPPSSLLYFCGNSGGPTVTGGPAVGYRVTTPSGLDFGLDDVTASWWRRPPAGTDAVQALHLYSQSWLWKVARIASDAGDTATVERLVAMALESFAAHPDTGRADDPQWNEGANLWREDAVTCLYWLTRDERLVPVVEATVRANLDPLRYYGPPRHVAHNHGLLANHALLLSAYVLARPAWRDAALARLAATARRWVTPKGLGVEQSAAYHQTNLALWAATLPLLALDGGDPPVEAVIREEVARARRALGALVMPDLRLVPYGDAVGGPEPLPTSGRGVLVDPVAGVAAGRWSFAAPDDFYLLRFGPRRIAHGHYEHGEAIWWARGRPVTADPSIATKVAGPVLTWQLSASAHTEAVPQRARFDPRGSLSLVEARTAGPVHRFVLRGGLWHQQQTRTVVVDSRRDTLTITDLAATKQTQAFQLDPRWLPVGISADRHRATFTDDTGGVLTLSTTGRIASARRGSPGLAGGWVFRVFSAWTPAARVLVAGGPAVATRLVVTGPPLRPWVPATSALPPASQRTASALALAAR